jgi:hypothetical protein
MTIDNIRMRDGMHYHNSGLCPELEFYVSGVGPSGSATRVQYALHIFHTVHICVQLMLLDGGPYIYV